MISAEGLSHAFTRNAAYLERHLDGLTHTNSLVQPPATGNCILWILGHILCYRNFTLQALGDAPIMPEAARFDAGSAPVTADSPDLPRFEALRAAFDQAQTRILEGIRRLTPEQAAEVITQGSFTLPRAELVMTYMRHESYHMGQFELLREIVLSQRA